MKSVLIHLPWQYSQHPPLLRQTPEGNGVWKGYRFYIHEAPEVCDYEVVFAGHQGLIQSSVAKRDSLFIAGEPPSIKKYADPYLAQFGGVISSDAEINHPRSILAQQGHPWFCGRKFIASGKGIPVKGYDDYVEESSIPKTKLMSVVCSDKQTRPGHRKRFEFVQRLKAVFGDDLDLFGTGQNLIEDKADAIRPYQYHIAIENSAYPHYWTEKLSDCYLEGAYPFYAGCPNIGDYFSDDAYAAINLDDLDASVEVIRAVIKRDQYQQSIQALHKAKLQVLNEYNFFNVIAEYFDAMSILEDKKKGGRFTAYPSKYFRKGVFYQAAFRMRCFLSR